MSSGVGNEQEEDSKLVYTLDLSSQKLQVIPTSLLKYKNCKSINLSCNSIKVIKEDQLSACSQLKELKLYSNKIEIINGLQKLRKLEDLQLQFNAIRSIGSSLKLNKNLKLLRLDSNMLTSIKTEDVCMLGNLTYLDVSSNRLQNIDCVNILTSLDELHCTHNLLVKILDLHSLKKLREVDASNNNLVDVSGLKMLPNLFVLKLEHNKLLDLKSLGTLKSLQELKLCHNQISDLKHLTDQFNRLEVLHISHNKISAVKDTEYLLKFSALRELIMLENPILREDKYKEEINQILKKLNLDMLDKVPVHIVPLKNRLPSAMRPMSANQMVSTRLIEDQMSHSEMFLAVYEDKLKSQFAVLHEMLSSLPATKPQSPTLSSQNSTQSLSSASRSSSGKLTSCRPTSRCSSRVRLEEAKAFANANMY